MGWIMVRQGDTAQGVEMLRKAVDHAPSAGVLHYHLGVALMKAGDKGQARSELQAAVTSGQDFPEKVDARRMLKDL